MNEGRKVSPPSWRLIAQLEEYSTWFDSEVNKALLSFLSNVYYCRRKSSLSNYRGQGIEAKSIRKYRQRLIGGALWHKKKKKKEKNFLSRFQN